MDSFDAALDTALAENSSDLPDSFFVSNKANSGWNSGDELAADPNAGDNEEVDELIDDDGDGDPEVGKAAGDMPGARRFWVSF
jgi:hypothetical protein